MNDAVKLEARLLTAAENELVAVTRPPEIERQSVDALKAAARRLREAHDRAKSIGTRQAREMRGKAEPRGAKLGEGQSGHRRQGASSARRAGSGGSGTRPPRRGCGEVEAKCTRDPGLILVLPGAGLDHARRLSPPPMSQAPIPAIQSGKG